jgi:hypothetical protein
VTPKAKTLIAYPYSKILLHKLKAYKKNAATILDVPISRIMLASRQNMAPSSRRPYL